MNSDVKSAYTASWVWTPGEEPRHGVFVVMEGGRVKELAAKPPAGVQVADLGQGLIMPGLINAHTHLELSFLAGAAPPRQDFVGWLHELVKSRPGHDKDQAARATARAVDEMARAGVACVADITNTGRAQPILAAAGLSAVSFFEALGEKKVQPPPAAYAWQGDTLTGFGVAAHAPYSVPSPRLRALKKQAGDLPFCIHAAESQAEVEFMLGYGQEGARLEDFLLERGLARQTLDLTGLRPVWHLQALGVLDRHTLVVHGVQITQEEIRMLAAAGSSLCLCPRSNLALTGAMAPIWHLIKSGVNLALGTDSLASAPDLSLWAEMAALHRAQPGLKPEVILTMATLGGARALGLEGQFGRLTPGAAGPLAFVPLPKLRRKKAVLEAVATGETAGPPQAVGRLAAVAAI